MKLILFIVRFVLSLRYRVRLTWVENLKHSWPILILPNHVALVDPRILIAFLWKYVIASPVAGEKYYNLPILRQAMDLVGAVPIWEMTAGANADEVKKVFSNIVDWLRQWKNILIYPSGQIYRQDFESIKWKQSAYYIANNMPENTKVIWIRQRWLWWSIWSKAWDNWETTFIKAYLKSIKYVFANLLFFVPKRNVNIEIVDITKEINENKTKSLNEFNKALEDFYNQKPTEQLKYIKHYFYYNDIKNHKKPEIISWSEEELSITNNYDLSEIPEEIKENIKEKISIIKQINISKIQDNSKLILDLFFDSLDAAEIKSYIQANFSTSSNPPIWDLKTIWDLYIMAIWKSQSNEELKKCNFKTTDFEQQIENLVLKLKNTDKKNILTLWKTEFSKNKNDNFLWDNILGSQTKKDFILKAYFISNRIKKLKWDYIWIMMPAVWGASLLIIATYLAKKTPVMFNWTLWKESFDHCVKFSKVDNIISVGSFYDRVKNDFLEEYNKNGKFLFLENLLKTWTILEKLAVLFKSFYLPIPKLNETWVILFTSGSESLPKAVSLTHANLIENIKWSLSIFELKNNDTLLWFLPPFHSFGFTINTIMPLITWLKVAYTPDPNDAKTILEIIKHTNITTITSTPTFLKMIMVLAWKEDLKNISYAVVWAERCPDEVFNKFSELAPNGVILEWYGITECSPVVSINPIVWSKKWTVWKIIPNLDCKILSLENQEELKLGEQWMIYVSWSSIFNWYLDEKLESPFDKIWEKNYYKTGDLWFINETWFLTITGRLKRFIKIAWEMISLPFIENVLLEKYWSDSELKIAIEALEKDGNAKIVLFSIEHIVIEEVNDYLRSRWVSNLVKISEVIKIVNIPVLWTGKIDYKSLKKLLS